MVASNSRGQAFHPRADGGSDRATAIRRDHVPRDRRGGLTGLGGADLGHDPVAAILAGQLGQLGQCHEFVAEQDPPGVALLGVAAQGRFEAQLRQLGRHDGPGRLVRLVQRAAAEAVHLVDQPGIQRSLAGERRLPADLAELLRGRGLSRHVLVQPVLAEDLHRALVEVVRLRQARGVGAAFDQQVAHAVVRQEDGGGQAGATTADDQYRDFHSCQGFALPGIRSSRNDGVREVPESEEFRRTPDNAKNSEELGEFWRVQRVQKARRARDGRRRVIPGPRARLRGAA